MSITQSVSSHGSGAASAAPAGQPVNYSLGIGYLRAFIVVLVVAHHAVLAYDSYAPPAGGSLLGPARWWRAFPIVDPHRSAALSIFVGFNDIFFMSLMFFLSGLFVWSSLRRKGAGTFLRDRALRLGVPFLFAAALIAPLAYYPTYLQSGAHGGVGGFLKVWFAQGDWPAGPAWFVWVLLMFDCIAALLFAAMPRAGEILARFASQASLHPVRFFALLVTVSAAAYLPMVLVFGPFDWFDFGPFFLQKSRALHYLVYFFAGVAVGAFGIERGLLAPDGKLARRWWLWAIRAPIAFVVAGFLGVMAMAPQNAAHPYLWGTIAGGGFVLACAVLGFAFLAVFVRFARKRGPIFDSLRDNSYGIYLVHYAFVSWLQYALLPAAWPGLAKGCIVFLSALTLSWITVAALRRIPRVASVV